MQLAGYTVRRATVDDAQTILDITAAHNVPLIGDPNATLDDVTDELVEPGFDLATDGWLVSSADAGAVGWGWVCRNGTSNKIDIAVYLRPGHETVAAWLWQQAQQRAIEIGRELSHEAITIDSGLYPSDKLVRDLAADDGFAVATSFVRMRIDHHQRVPVPPPPDGVELRHGTDVEVRRHAHAVRNESFADHFGNVDKTFEEWSTDREASSSHDWSLVHVAYVDGEPAATLVRTNNFLQDEDCGYVLTLGTSPRYQGRGLAGYLLRYAFADDAALGRTGTILHVDTNPERPALGLYKRHGMREVLTIDAWRRSVNISNGQ